MKNNFFRNFLSRGIFWSTSCLLLVTVVACMQKNESVVDSADQSSSKDTALNVTEKPEELEDDESRNLAAEQYELMRLDSIKRMEEQLAKVEKEQISEKSIQSESATRNSEKSEKRDVSTTTESPSRSRRVKYASRMAVDLLDERITWSSVGSGNYEISVIRVSDNMVVYSQNSSNTSLSYANMGLDEFVRYSLKVSYPNKNLVETKSFSLIGNGTLLNPTCK